MKEVLGLTISSKSIDSRILNWKVSPEDSFSDHKYIYFDLDTSPTITEEFRLRTWNNFDEGCYGDKGFTDLK